MTLVESLFPILPSLPTAILIPTHGYHRRFIFGREKRSKHLQGGHHDHDLHRNKAFGRPNSNWGYYLHNFQARKLVHPSLPTLYDARGRHFITTSILTTLFTPPLLTPPPPPQTDTRTKGRGRPCCKIMKSTFF